ncbi:MAG: HAMP domain-containing protein [Planctomycetes bacterium]|nr:HAMP domain-containing protein [Planctomycetota bacterium]
MKIKEKLILGFVGIASLVGVIGYICVYTSQRSLQKTIGENSVTLAIETIDKIDRALGYTIEDFQAYSKSLLLQKAVTKSNQDFDKLDNIQDYIDNKDREWISAQEETTISLSQELMNNELSEELKKKIEFYQEKHGHKIFAEIFVTNKYGTNVSLTEKTSDYKQNDEEWWQRSKEDGLYVSDIEYDESAGVYCTSIAIRIEDDKGNFSGVIKVVPNIQETINIIKHAKESIKYKTAEFKLLTKKGNVIYDTAGKFEFFEDVSSVEYFNKITSDTGYVLKDAEEEEETVLLSYARSNGSKEYKGLGWILVIDYQTSEIFAPVTILKNVISSASLLLTVLAIILGLCISNYISRPFSKLRNAIDKISKGNLDYKIEVNTKDELDELAIAFNQMTRQRKQNEDALVSTARRVGIAETATNVLHNVGNVLNSVSVTTASIQKKVRESKISYLADTVDLLEEHKDDLSTFLTIEERGRKLPVFLANLSKELIAEQERSLERLDTLTKHVEHMVDIIQLQQSYSKTKSLTEPVSITKLVEDAIRINAEALTRHGVEEKCELVELPLVLLDRHKVLQILINLISNAKYSLSDSGREDKILIVRVTEPQSGLFRIEVHDNGIGIAKENLTRIFEHGFTTKKDGYGFGLHSAAIAAKEMNSSLIVDSEGLDKGAVFTLELPFQTQEVAK